MTKWSDTLKYYLQKRKAKLLLIIVFSLLLISGIQISYAFYNSSSAISILANKIGDFDTGDGDVNIMIYRENDEGKFIRSYGVPAIGYVYNSTLTSCTITCDTNASSACHYSYDAESKEISLTSDQKVTCKFYFEKETESDINVYILKEDTNGTYNYNSKTYSLVNGVPAYGYEFDSYTCDNSATLVYNSELKKFDVETTGKNTCYAYFNSVGSADIIANVYVQSSAGSTVYNEVSYIPANQLYVLSTSRTSQCYDDSATVLNTTINYTDGYIVIDAVQKQTCDIYLDLQ